MHFDSVSHFYVEYVAGEARGVPIVAFVNEKFAQLGGRFAMLSRLSAKFSLVQAVSVKIGAAQVDCLEIKVQPLGASWDEHLWIQPNSGIVWKSSLHRHGSTNEMASDQTISWHQVVIDEPVMEEEFWFRPSKRVKRVDDLK